MSVLNCIPAHGDAGGGPRRCGTAVGADDSEFSMRNPTFLGPMTTSNDGVLQICVEITATATREERVSDHKTGRAAAATWQRALWCERWAKSNLKTFATAPIAVINCHS